MIGRRGFRVGRAACTIGRMGTFVCATGIVVAACSSANPTGASIYTDAGSLQQPPSAPIPSASGGTVKAFTPPADPGANAIYVTMSGESNAITGYPFPPGDWTNDTFLPDGWQFTIEEYIVNVDHVTLWSNPDQSPSDQSQHGAPVATLDGPFVVDLHKGGPLVGAGGTPEEAVPIGVISNQNQNGGAAFSSTDPYAFGFSTVAASYTGYNVNLTSDEFDDFDYMVKNGYSVLYVGTARWMGSQSQFGCTQTTVSSTLPDGGASSGDAGDGGAGSGGYDFSKLPQSMTFRLGFSTPTNYVNCQNQSLHGTPNPGEDYPRGLQISTSQSTIAQVTVHMDHPLWESFAEDTPVHWDQIAAQYVGATGVPEAHVEDMRGVPFYAFTDKTGAPLPWRNCAGTYYTPPGNGQMFFNPLSVPVNPTATCVAGNCQYIRDYEDFMRYTQSTQGHLNSQGLCFIDRQYPAPAGGS